MQALLSKGASHLRRPVLSLSRTMALSTAAGHRSGEPFPRIERFPFGQLPPIKTPQLQDRRIEKVRLSNGINAVLVSDPSAPYSAACLSVEAGSWKDGRHEGTAHFLEHMLFLGTKSFPKEYEYERFIFDSNGTLNGYTSSDHSLYYFSSVSPDAFDGALERFSKFFHEPLFNESCVDREMKAVDQEYRKNIEQDGWRILHVNKELANQSHPFAMFNTGNLDTMKLIDRDYLREWFKQNYSSNLMNLVLYAPASIEKLAQSAETLFSVIPNSKVARLSTKDMPIFPDSLKRSMVWIEPVKDLKQISLSWEIPPTFVNMSSRAASLLSRVIGYEGQGSLLSYLKEQALAESLSAGASEYGADNVFFDISIGLTEKGLKDWKTVVGCVFQALEVFKQSPYPAHIFNEANFVNTVHWQYQQRHPNLATTYTKMLRREGLESFPERSLFYQEFRPELIVELLSRLTPDDCLTTMVSQAPEIELDRRERWMGARYGLMPIDLAGLVSKSVSPELSAKVYYPPPNRFIPDNLVLHPVLLPGDPSPCQIIKTPNSALYHHHDAEFPVPESFYIFKVRTPSIRPHNARSLALAELYSRFVNEELNELSYEAASGGLHFSVSESEGTGIKLSVGGYSQKTSMLLESVLQTLRRPRLDITKFEIFKESIERSYKNALWNPPMSQAMERLSSLIYTEYCTSAQLAEAIAQVTLADLAQFADTLYAQYNVEGFVGGNVLEQDARRAWDMLHHTLGGQECSQQLTKKSSVVPLDTAQPQLHQFSVNVKGNAIQWISEVGPKTIEDRIGQELLAKLYKEPFYSELRTKQQTGYIVGSSSFEMDKRLFMHSVVQSNTHDPRDLLSRIELFNETFLRDLGESNENQSRFDSIKASILTRLNNPYDSLASKVRFLNYVAFEENADFALLEKRKQALAAYQLADLRKFATTTLGWENKRRLAVLATGNSSENVAFSYRDFKARL
ncbi:Metalloenzyme, LuxS/M16 peptidase-like protein [Polychytrium aggregatum]|uniref:Metalloenzyme, LuxS/M16 peptidase-like protein n=1 Tax=Polychytrium aggregatum TaxID=110093 RepID=UPI0022FE07D1|nr:Metalloenzyme, LuxS/M16 peptidase-like protein [Polychytrium aggregatum]KAI9197372.1 Metalloenzyme, LuxS/M16 peptidase-like protein [Polychytrium aggregatum]